MLDYLRANRLDSYPIQERSIILPRLLQSIRLNTPQNGLKSSFDCRHFTHLQTHLTHCFPFSAGRLNGKRRRGASRGTAVVLSMGLSLCQFSVLSTGTARICCLLFHPPHSPIHPQLLSFFRFYRPLHSTPSTTRIAAAIADSSFSSLSAMRFPRFHVFVC